MVDGVNCITRIETTFGVKEGERETARLITPYGEIIDIEGKHTKRVVSRNAIELPQHFKQKLKDLCDQLPGNVEAKEMAMMIHNCFWTFCLQLKREGGGKLPIEFSSEWCPKYFNVVLFTSSVVHTPHYVKKYMFAF